MRLLLRSLGFKGVRGRMALLMVLGTLPGLLVAVGVCTLYTAVTMRDAAAAEVGRVAERYARSLAGWDTQILRLLRTVAENPAVSGADAAARREALCRVARVYPELRPVMIVDVTGRNVARADDLPPKAYGDRAWFKQAMAGRVGREMVLSRTTGRPSLSVAMPVRDAAGAVAAVVDVGINRDLLTSNIGHCRIGRTGYAALVDDRGLPLVDLDPSLPDAITDPADVRAAVGGGAAGAGRDFTDSAGRRWYVVSLPVVNGWHVLAAQRRGELWSGARPLVAVAAALCLATLALACVAGRMLGGRAVHPLLRLREAADRLAGGDFAVRAAAPAGADELASLADAFNLMADKLGRTCADLRRSNERFTLLTEALPQIVWTTAPDGSVDFFNNRWEACTGQTFEQSRGGGWAAAIHPDDLPECSRRWSRAVATGEPYEIEYRLTNLVAGGHRWHLGRGLPMRRADGAIAFWVGTCTDVHDFRRMRDELAEAQATLERRVAQRTAELEAVNRRLSRAQQLLSSVLNASPDGVIALECVRDGGSTDGGGETDGGDGTIVDFQWVMMNPAAETLLGRRLYDVEARTLLAALPGQRDSGLLADYARVVRTGQPLYRELRYQWDGVDAWLRVSAVKLGDGVALTLADISDRKRDEQALIASEREARKLALVVARTTSAVAVVKPDFTIDWANEAFSRITGFDLDEARGREINALLNGPLTDRAVAESIRRELSALRPVRAEIQRYTKSGEPRWFVVDASPVLDDAGRLESFVGFHHDVTDARRMADALRAKEELLRTFVEHTPAAIAMLDLDYNYLFASRRWRADYGLGEQPLTGRCHHDVFPDLPERYRENHRKILSGEAPSLAGEDCYERADGQHLWLKWELQPWRDAGGGISGLIIFTETISARKEAERTLEEQKSFLRHVIDLNPNLIFAKDADGRFTLVNRAVADRYGTTVEKLIGRTAAEAGGAAEDVGRWAESDRKVVETGREMFIDEEPVTDAAGRVRVMQTIKRPLIGPHGTRLLGVSTDITVIKRSQEELARYNAELISTKDAIERQAQALLDTAYELDRARATAEAALVAARAASQAKSAFLANMSHEIRTPITAVLGFSEMMLDAGQSPDERADCLHTVRRNAKQLLELINDVLDLSKIEAGRMAVERAPTDVPALVADVASMTRRRAHDQGLKFDVVYDAPVPRTALTDGLRLRQILMNLLGNALKFTAGGGICLRVGRVGGADAAALRFSVVDTGMGMTDEQLARLFQPFTQADDSMTRRFGGTGLGLTISRRLSELLGGWLTVCSQEGAGSTFTLTVATGPAGQWVSHPIEAVTPSLPVDAGGPLPTLRGTRLLLAEDGKDNQRFLAAVLRRAGAEVAIAGDGVIALEQVAAAEGRAAGTDAGDAAKAAEAGAARPFDAVLMDMQMPRMDGYAAAAELRRRGFAPPVIALTAHAMAEDRARCLAAGCSDYLTKPIDAARLLHAVAAAVAAHRGTPAMTGEATPVAPAPAEPQRPDDAPSSAPPSPVDAAWLESTMNGDPEMTDLIPQFVAELPGYVSELTRQLAEHDLRTLRGKLHELKGAGGSYGFAALSEAAGVAEASVKADAALDRVRDEVESLLALMRRVRGYDPAAERGPDVPATAGDDEVRCADLIAADEPHEFFASRRWTYPAIARRVLWREVRRRRGVRPHGLQARVTGRPVPQRPPNSARDGNRLPVTRACSPCARTPRRRRTSRYRT